MATQTKRATIYFDPDLHKALRLKACRHLPLVSFTSTYSRNIKNSFQSILAQPENDLAKSDKTLCGIITARELLSFLFCDKSPFQKLFEKHLK
jgi:hypothetical protein